MDGHDDIIAEDYVGRCIEGLEQDPDVVLCFTHTNHIDASGERITRPEHQITAITDSPSERFSSVIRNKH